MLHLLLLLSVFSGPAPAQAPSSDAPKPSADNPRATVDAPRRNYIVGAQDVLKVTVFDEPQLSGTFRVDTDGTFTYPFVGSLKAVGQNLRSIEEELAKRLADGYVRRPQVTIEVEQYRARSVFIVGEVRTPGKYPLNGDMTLLEAIAQAGSTTQSAGFEVLILRPSEPGREQQLEPGATPSNQTTRVSLADLQAGRLGNNVVLQEGDTIFVPRAERFYVSGHVRNPGAYTHERGMTVLQAISLAGGLSDRGSDRGIKAVRLVNGVRKEVGVRLSDPIQPNDTLVIRQRLL
jgi:polysaccharide export outer membrane protein